jgi:hypothetical protein
MAGCGRSTGVCSPRSGATKLGLLKVDNAASDAVQAYKSGDHRLIGVYGYSVEIPGLRGDPYQYLRGVRMLEGTGDVFCTNEEEVLNKNARAYAKKYNEAMLKELKLNKG